jgi:uncharacterized repeat protein (TIGR01451 family)
VDNPLSSPATQITNVVHSSEGSCNAAPEVEPGCSVGTTLDPPELTTTKTLVEVNEQPATEGQTVLPGDRLTYAITIANDGAATTTTLTDHVPANTTYAGVGEGWTPCVASPTPSPEGTECAQNVPVPAATTEGGPGKAAVHFTVKVDNPLTVTPASVITNTVSSSEGSCHVAPSTEPGCSVGTTLTPPALTTTKTLVEVNGKTVTPGQTPTVLPGDTLTYTITVENKGAATTTTLTDHVPTNTTYAGVGEGWEHCVSAPPSSAGTACEQNVPVPAATTTGGPGKATRTFTVKVDSPLPSGTTEITNTVHSSEGTCQLDPSAEPGCTATNPTPPNPTTTKTLAEVDGDPATPGQTVRPGDTLTYLITVTNSGGTPATPTLTDRVPANTTYAGVGEGWEHCVVEPVPSPAETPCTQVVPVPAATATEPSSVTVHFTVKVDDPLPSGAFEIRNVVTSDEGTCQVAEPACTATNPTPAELTTTKTLALVNGNLATPGQMILPGEKLTYDITVTNHGGTSATPTLTDPVPANTSYTGPATEGWGPSCVATPPSPAGTACTQVVTVPAATATEVGKATVHFTLKVNETLPSGTTEITNVVTSSEGTCQVAEPACTVTDPVRPPTVPPPPVPPAPVPPPTFGPAKLAQTVVRGRAFAHGPSECVVGNARVYVTGRRIKSVTFYLDGPHVKTLKRPDKRGRYLVNINARTLGSGVQRVKMVVVFVPSSKTKSKTMYVLVARCRPPRPVFTG